MVPITYAIADDAQTVKCRHHFGSEGERVSDRRRKRITRELSSLGFHRFFAGGCGSPLYQRNDARPGDLFVFASALWTGILREPANRISCSA
jgi:hypothetical protein